MNRQKSGISLIVLVITIIVMIVLAATIIISLNNTGIISNANKAKNSMNESQEREMLIASVLIAKKDSITSSELMPINLYKETEKQFGQKQLVAYNSNDCYTVYMTGKNEKIYFVNKSGEIQKITESSFSKLSDETSNPSSILDISGEEIHISSAKQFKQLADIVNGGNRLYGKKIYLERNLDLENIEWTPIGSNTKPLYAAFDGKDHIIKGIHVLYENEFSGLFGYTAESIKNLTIKDSYVEGNRRVGGIVGLCVKNIENCNNINTKVVNNSSVQVGGIAGRVNGEYVKNCLNSGEVISNSKNDSGNSVAGGIIGISYNATVTNCYNAGNVSAIGGYSAGIAAYLAKNIKYCYNFGNVSGVKGVAGIVGLAEKLVEDTSTDNKSLEYCENYGTVQNTGEYTSGIVGETSSHSILSCSNMGQIIGSTQYTGGIAGLAALKISECYNTGDVEASGDSVGGIVGDCLVDYAQNITKCYNSGKITGNSAVGGISGWFGSSSSQGPNISMCYSKGNVTANSFKGAIVGRSDCTSGTFTINKCYYYSGTNIDVGSDSELINNSIDKIDTNLNNYSEFLNWLAKQ